MGLLEGKTALITGAARGIGKAIALKYASEGCNIAFTDLEINEETEQEIAALGVKAKSYASNAADFAQTEEVVKAVKEEDTKPQVAKVVYGALGKFRRN